MKSLKILVCSTLNNTFGDFLEKEESYLLQQNISIKLNYRLNIEATFFEYG